MNNFILGLVLLAGACIGVLGIHIGNKAAQVKADREELERRKEEQKRLQAESDRRKKANEQKESMETGNSAADFVNSINAINELRHKTAGRK